METEGGVGKSEETGEEGREGGRRSCGTTIVERRGREKMMRGADTRVSGRMVLVRREGDIWG